MSSHIAPTAEATLWARLAESQAEILTPDTAHYLLGFSLTDDDQCRQQELAERSQGGTLSEEEGREFDSYLHMGNLLAVMQSKAHLVLADSKTGSASAVNPTLARQVYQRANGVCEYVTFPPSIFL